jgi:glycosyltransferase involved in cell wall biosynthesis
VKTRVAIPKHSASRPARRPLLSIVIPAFNEAPRLPESLPRLAASLAFPHDTEVIVVDDGSDDDTPAVALSGLRCFPRSRVLRLPRRQGKGAAVRLGVSAAHGQSIVFMDADASPDPRDMIRVLGGLERADVAIGSRAAPGALVTASRTRAIMGRNFNSIVRAVTGIPSRDTQCGFKAFRAPAAKLLFHLGRVDGFAFDVELLVLARQLGYRVVEVPVRWHAAEGSHVRAHHPLSMVVDVVRTQLRSTGRRSSGLPEVTPCAGLPLGDIVASARGERFGLVDAGVS